jgi:hypothetical protein
MLAFQLTQPSEIRTVGWNPPAEYGLTDKVISSVNDLRVADPLVFYLTAALVVITLVLFCILMCLPSPKPIPQRKEAGAGSSRKERAPAAASGKRPVEAKKDQ